MQDIVKYNVFEYFELIDKYNISYEEAGKVGKIANDYCASARIAKTMADYDGFGELYVYPKWIWDKALAIHKIKEGI